MSKHGRSVRPQELQTPESDLELEDRRPPFTVVEGTTTLRERISEARALRAPDGSPCRACWQAGLQAALATLAGPPGEDRDVVADRLAAARALDPGGLHWRACWLEGRDAAIAAVEG